MEIKIKNKLGEFFRNYGTILVSAMFILAIAVTLLVVGLQPANDATTNVGNNNQIVEEEKKPVNSQVAVYALPMNNASVVKDYSNTELQYNQTLNRWEAHLSVDLMSVDTEVMAIYNGKVISVENDFLMGNIVTIEHESGLVSVYASLDDNLKVAVGDSVTTGQLIGYAGSSASTESAEGVHLDFSMMLNGEEVDPNNYLALQNK
jgi:murein DD-endopeptidase MepM/ murein hydrolase activator NlpD